MTEERNYEQEAQEQGWKPESEWNNPDKPWIDAQPFVEKGERIAGIARSKAEREKVQFEGRIATLERDAQLAKTVAEEFAEYKDGQLARSEARNKELLNEAARNRSQAVADNDGEAFYKADREYEEAKDSMNAPPPQQSNGGNQPNPLFDAWLINNDWYNNDPTLKAIADGIEGQIQSEGYSGPAYYSEVTRRVKEMAPDSFGSKRKTAATAVEAGGELEVKPDSNAHIYDNLPPEAKAACDKFVATGHTTKDSYCATYEWD